MFFGVMVMEVEMTYGQLLVLLLGVVLFAMFWRLIFPPSAFRQEYQAPQRLPEKRREPEHQEPDIAIEYQNPAPATQQSARPLIDQMAARSLVAQPNSLVAMPGEQQDAYQRECSLADECVRMAKNAVSKDPAQAQSYLAALRAERAKYSWHSDEAHMIGTLIYHLDAELSERRRELK